MGCRKDNPSLVDVGNNDNTIRNLRVFRPNSAGNSGTVDQGMVQIADDPVPCRKRSRKN